jgi:PAS domain S-box-containing protein
MSSGASSLAASGLPERNRDKIRPMSIVTHPGWAAEDEVRRLNTLYELLAALSRATGLEEVYDAALTSLLAATSADRAAILFFDEDGTIRFKAWRGLSAEYRAAVTGHTPWPKGTLRATPIVTPDVLAEESLRAFHEIFLREGIRSLGFVPLAFTSGVFGKLMLYYPKPNQCTPGDILVTEAIAAHVALATERKHIEWTAQRTERRFQAILDNAASVIFLKDVDGRYQLVNRRFEELFHVRKEEAFGKTDYELFSPDIAARFRENDRAVLESGAPLTVEEHAPHEDGLHAYVSMKFPLKEADGSVAGVCGIATDISDRKHLEIASLHLASIVENSHDAIISKDLNGIITSWNKGAERLFGYTAAEAVGKPISLLAVSDDLNEMPDILSKIRRGERVEHYETRRRKKDGEIVNVSLTVSPIRDSSGQIVGASKISRDITDRKRAEEERTLLLAREQEAYQTAQLLNRVGPRLATRLDFKELVQDVTDMARALVGAEFGSFFHNLVNEKGESYMLYTLSGVSADAFAGFPMPRNTAIFGSTFRGEGIVRSDDITKDPRYGKSSPHYGMPKGHLPVCSYLAAPVLSRTGEVLGGLFFGHSLPGRFTENHEALLLGIASQAGIAMDNARLFQQAEWAQTELKRSNEELRRANQDLETFAYSASHDLQEPLRTIALCSQMLERRLGGSIPPDEVGFLRTIITGAKRMTMLVQDLLAYTKATKHPEGPPPSIDPTSVLASTLDNLRGPIEEARATVTSEKLPPICIHETRLFQLFQNLISNAVKYRGKEAPRIHISAEERDGWCVFSVVDNGIGIEMQFAEQIFQIFKRLHVRDEYEGSGVGLAVCQRIVEQYGGRIWLEKSAIGKGSTFCFAVPASRSEAAAPPESSAL